MSRLHVFVFIAAFLSGFFVSLAYAHDHAKWIMDNPETKYCCTPKDCFMLKDDEVAQVKGGWMVRGYPVAKEHIYPVETSGEGAAKFWGCFYPNGEPRCLFIPALF